MKAAAPTGDRQRRSAVLRPQRRDQKIRGEVKQTLEAADPKIETKDSDYVFITFVLQLSAARRDRLAHGGDFLRGACLRRAAELNALGSTTEVDFYRPLLGRRRAKSITCWSLEVLTAAWGVVAIGFALFANLVENLIEAVKSSAQFFTAASSDFPGRVFPAVRPRHSSFRRCAHLAGARPRALLRHQHRLPLV